MRLRQPRPVALAHCGLAPHRFSTLELNLELGISIIAEKAQSLTGATGAAIALRKGNEIVCRARTGRTARTLASICRRTLDFLPTASAPGKFSCVTTRSQILALTWPVLGVWGYARFWLRRSGTSAEHSEYLRYFPPLPMRSTTMTLPRCSFCPE